MRIDRHYADPQLVGVYDLENAGRDDIEFYLALAAELGAADVVDLGCGTGVLACDLAERGHHVTGVDPAPAMLDVARARPGGDKVTWIDGDAAMLATASADLAVMTGHVAQVFITDDEWRKTLTSLYRTLRSGGHLAFESRNPDAASWHAWNRENSSASFALADGDSFTSWVEVTHVEAGTVTVEGHNVFASRGEDIVSSSTLRFRSRAEHETALADAGFVLHRIYGDWDRGPVTATSPELVIVASRP